MKTSVPLLVFIIPLVVTRETNDTETPIHFNEMIESYSGSKIDQSNKNADFECEASWRLPRTILPTHYNITLRTDPNNPIFNGTVMIDIECVELAENITLHSRGLNISIDSIAIERNPGIGPAVTIRNVTMDHQHEMIHIQLGSTLEKGNYTLRIPNFVGRIQEEDIGLFNRTYKVKISENATDSTRKLIASQLEATLARMVFPCFDEPNMKATFTIHIERPSSYKSFSNMPLTNSTPMSEGRVLDTFEKSALLPTYAIAFLVADYSRYPDSESDRTNILVPEQDLDKVNFAYGVAVTALRELESYTKIPYPVRKIDHASIPDFPTVAMENWGLILYERAYIVDDWKTPILTRQSGLTLIAHELAHQWFGNMVTTEWWSYLWLNEGFATFFQYYISDKILPEWQLWNQFLVLHFQEALSSDAKTEKPTSAMTSPRCTPEEIKEAFNEISYDKGASILKMIQFILGEDEFQSAIRLYLQRRSMRNARPADLFQVLDEINIQLNKRPLPKNVTFREFGSSWTEQAGFPVITVTRDYHSSSIFIQQERFFSQRSRNISVVNQENRWWVPLTWTTASLRNTTRRPQDWLHADKSVRVNVEKNDWILFNTNAEGYYRVNYDQRNWDLLIRGLEHSSNDFSIPNRIQFIDDVFTLGFAHRLNLGTALSLSRFLREEVDVVVWHSASKQFHDLFELVASAPAYPELENYLQNLMRDAYRRVRLDIRTNEPHMDKLLRTHLAPVACEFGLDLCLIDAHFALSQFVADVMLKDEQSAIENVHHDVRWTVLCGGIQSGTENHFEVVRSLAMNFSSKSENQESYLLALSCTKDFPLLTRHLEEIFNNNTLLTNDQAFRAVTSVLQNQRSLYTGYQFVRNNVNKINRYYNCSTNYTEALVKEISNNIRTISLYDEIHRWIVSSNGDELGNKTMLLQHLESRKPEVEWSSESVQQISDWLNTPASTLPLPIAVLKGTKSVAASLTALIALIVFLRTVL